MGALHLIQRGRFCSLFVPSLSHWCHLGTILVPTTARQPLRSQAQQPLRSQARQPLRSQARQPQSLAQQPQSLAQQQQCWQPEQRQQLGLCWLGKLDRRRRGFAAPTAILLPQPAKSELLLPLLPTLLLLTSQMATLGLTQRLRATAHPRWGPWALGPGWHLRSQAQGNLGCHLRSQQQQRFQQQQC